MTADVVITRRLEFDYGHRVLKHESKCKNLHGHRGAVEITVQGPQLDELGRVVDFGVVKQLVGGWIDEHWDHNVILHPHDALMFLSRYPHLVIKYSNPEVRAGQVFGDKQPFEMPDGMNPTAENLAIVLFDRAGKLLPSPLRIVCVKFYETPNCSATYPAHAIGYDFGRELTEQEADALLRR